MKIVSAAVVLLSLAAGGVCAGGADPRVPSTMNRQNYSEATRSAGGFRHMDELFPTRTIRRAGPVLVLEEAPEKMEWSYEFRGETYGVEDFARRAHTTGLLVLHQGRIVREGYYQGADERSRFASFSIAKSFLSTLYGFALAEGKVRSLDDTAETYLPDLKGTAYEGVRLRDILEMSSGTSYIESFDKPGAGIMGLLDVINRSDGSLYDYSKSFPRKWQPGTRWNYASTDAVVLGGILRRALGGNLTDYMSEKLWQPLGAEADATWIVDGPGAAAPEIATVGLNLRLRDYARFGYLMAHDGVIAGRRIVPAGWVSQATVPQREQVTYGKASSVGYGYLWWALPGPERAFVAQGIHGQWILVNPKLDLVVVLLSNWPQPMDQGLNSETIALLDALMSKVRDEG